MDLWRATSSTTFVLLLYCLLGEAIHVADVHRLFQMERANISYGSQKTSFNLLAQSITSNSLENDYQQRVVLIRLVDFSLDLLDTLISKNAEAVLLLFPEQDNTQYSNKWHELEVHFFQQSYKIPIYFAIEDSALLKMYKDTLPSSTAFDDKHLSDSYQLVVSQNDPSSINDLPILNFQGRLFGKVNESNDEENIEDSSISQRQKPSILLVSSAFHTFSISPSFIGTSSSINTSYISEEDRVEGSKLDTEINKRASGATGYASTASSLTALLEVSRLFSKLYSNSKTQSEYDILFLVTGGGFANYAGDNHWINTISEIDSYLLNSIQFVLCIDSLIPEATNDKVFLHVSKLPKDANVIKFYQAFNRTAQKMNIDFEIVHKKIDFSKATVDSDLISDVEYQWEHELFSIKRFLSATLSTSPIAYPSYAKSHLLDSLDKVNIDILLRNIQFLAESIAKYVYSVSTQQEIEIFGNKVVSREFVESWMRTLTDSSMSAHQRSFSSPSSKQSTNKLLQGIEHLLLTYTNEVINQSFTLDTVSSSENLPLFEATSQKIRPSHYRIFGGSKSALSIYKTKPVSFDVLLAVVIYSYLIIAYAVLKGPSEAFSQLKGILNFQKAANKKKNK